MEPEENKKAISMKPFTWIKLIIVMTVLAFCLFMVLTGKIRYGMDLKENYNLIYKFEFIIEPKDNADRRKKIEQGLATVRKRIDPSGINRISATILDNDRIGVQLSAGKENTSKATIKLKNEIKEMLKIRGQLSFHLIAKDGDNSPEIKSYKMANSQIEYKLEEAFFKNGVRRAWSCPSIQKSEWGIQIMFNKETSQKFYQLTKILAKENRKEAIVLDDEIISFPEISLSSVYFFGNFSHERAEFIATILMSGSLPFRLTLIEE